MLWTCWPRWLFPSFLLRRKRTRSAHPWTCAFALKDTWLQLGWGHGERDAAEPPEKPTVRHRKDPSGLPQSAFFTVERHLEQDCNTTEANEKPPPPPLGAARSMERLPQHRQPLLSSEGLPSNML